jgi:hypothetical protein
VAAGIRSRYGRGLAIAGQDNLRRAVLRERDIPGGASIGLIDTVARYALDRGYHAIVEGILYAAHYAGMLTALRQDHRGTSRLYYLDIPFGETMRRHATKPRAAEYGLAGMSGWYREHGLLGADAEHVIIPAASSLGDTAERIMRETGLRPRPEPGSRRTASVTRQQRAARDHRGGTTARRAADEPACSRGRPGRVLMRFLPGSRRRERAGCPPPTGGPGVVVTPARTCASARSRAGRSFGSPLAAARRWASRV